MRQRTHQQKEPQSTESLLHAGQCAQHHAKKPSGLTVTFTTLSQSWALSAHRNNVRDSTRPQAGTEAMHLWPRQRNLTPHAQERPIQRDTFGGLVTALWSQSHDRTDARDARTTGNSEKSLTHALAMKRLRRRSALRNQSSLAVRANDLKKTYGAQLPKNVCCWQRRYSNILHRKRAAE